jgi:hypothetical protein
MYRIVESRRIKELGGGIRTVPEFHVEKSETVLFFLTVWNRYLLSYNNLEDAQKFVNALIEEENFGEKIVK